MEQGAGNREQGTGSREQGAGSREQGIGENYFLIPDLLLITHYCALSRPAALTLLITHYQLPITHYPLPIKIFSDDSK